MVDRGGQPTGSSKRWKGVQTDDMKIVHDEGNDVTRPKENKGPLRFVDRAG